MSNLISPDGIPLAPPSHYHSCHRCRKRKRVSGPQSGNCLDCARGRWICPPCRCDCNGCRIRRGQASPPIPQVPQANPYTSWYASMDQAVANAEAALAAHQATSATSAQQHVINWMTSNTPLGGSQG